MRIISASLTTDQIIASVQRVTRGEPPLKDVTRRLGWEYVEPGERLQVVKKAMGRKNGEPLVKLAVIEVVSRRREVLRTVLVGGSFNAYGREECRREGFGVMSDEEMEAHDKLDGIIGPRRAINGDPKMFVQFFCATHKVKIPGTKRTRPCTPKDAVTRIEFKYVIHWQVRHKSTGKWLNQYENLLVCTLPPTVINNLVPHPPWPLKPSEFVTNAIAAEALVRTPFGIKNLELVAFSGDTEIP